MPMTIDVRRLREPFDQRPVIFPRGLDESLFRGTPGAESGHEGTVIPAQHDHVGVRLVQAVMLRKLRLLRRFVLTLATMPCLPTHEVPFRAGRGFALLHDL